MTPLSERTRENEIKDMGELTDEQVIILDEADRTGKKPSGQDLKIVRGFHWCPDWDYLPICDDSPEIYGCTCSRDELEINPEDILTSDRRILKADETPRPRK